MTTSPPWWQVPVNKPTDGETYWVTFDRFFSKPFQASWDEAAMAWRELVYGTSYPWYVTPFYRKL